MPNAKNKNFSSQKGFTLIELLVVFSLIAILSGIGFASFVSYSRKQILLQAAAEMKQAVSLARFNSLSFVKPTSIPSLCAQNQLSSYQVNFCLNSPIPSCAQGNAYEVILNCGGQTVIKSGKFPQNITDSNVTVNNNCQTITFNTLNNIVTGVPCDIKISGYGNDVVLHVDAQGYVSY